MLSPCHLVLTQVSLTVLEKDTQESDPASEVTRGHKFKLVRVTAQATVVALAGAE